MEELEHNRELMHDYLKSVNRKFTIEREELLDVINAMNGIYTLNDLYAQTLKNRVVHAKSTLYRIIHLFLNAGLINEIKRSNEDILFESNHEQTRAHLLCVVCGKITPVDDTRQAKVLRQAYNKREFTPLSHSHVIKGYCRKCQKHASRNQTPETKTFSPESAKN